MKLKGRYALISGASSGFGKAVAEAFVKQGASVIICARNKEPLARTKDELSRSMGRGQRLLAAVADVADRIEMDSLVATSLSEFPHLDILVNNAGVYGPMGAVEDVGWEEWVNAVNINLMGTVYLCRAVIGHFKKRRYGKIINLSGGGATKPMPCMSAYAASKAAVVRFTETLAMEVKGFNIDVNAVAPGALNTRLLDSALKAGPEKIGMDAYRRFVEQKRSGGDPLEKGASLCVFLASAESDGITGKLISAVWDEWEKLPAHIEELNSTDIYTLRRIVPQERAKGWD